MGETKETGHAGAINADVPLNTQPESEVGMSPAHSKLSPAFQFYARDFIASPKVDRMAMTERGAYITLLARCWLDNGLPTDLKELAYFCRMKPSQFERMWKAGKIGQCFHERAGKLHNERLDIERKKQTENRKRQSDNAAAGWNRRRNATALPDIVAHHDSGITRAHAPAAESNSNQQSQGSSSSKKKGVEFRADIALRRLQDAYPESRVTSGFRTEDAFWQQVSQYSNGEQAAFELMLENLSNHIRSHEWRIKGMIPGLEKWLRDGLWLRRLHDSAPVADQLSKSTNKTLAAAAEIMRGES